jgi:hypothetical protein
MQGILASMMEAKNLTGEELVARAGR